MCSGVGGRACCRRHTHPSTVSTARTSAMSAVLLLFSIAVFLLAISAQGQQSFTLAAGDLLVRYQTAPGFINETGFEEFYHFFLGGEPELVPAPKRDVIDTHFDDVARRRRTGTLC